MAKPRMESIDFVEMRNEAARQRGRARPPRRCNSTPAIDSVYVVAVIGAPCTGKSSSAAPTAVAAALQCVADAICLLV